MNRHLTMINRLKFVVLGLVLFVAFQLGFFIYSHRVVAQTETVQINAAQFPTIITPTLLGSTGQRGGSTLASTQFYGWRFKLTKAVEITHVGGHLLGNFSGDSTIFGAIISLSSPNALPTGNPFTTGEVLASTTLTPTAPSSEILVPLSVTLKPGNYALVFGSGLFNAFGIGAMPNYTDQLDLPGTSLSSYFFWDGTESRWRDGTDGGTTHVRFLVRYQ